MFTGDPGDPPLSILANFTESPKALFFSVTVFGNQAMFDIDEDVGELAVAPSRLVVTVNGAASFTPVNSRRDSRASHRASAWHRFERNCDKARKKLKKP